MWVIAAVFGGSILWSMWAETIQPLAQAGDMRAVWLHLVGLPLILLGTAVIIYGGFIFIRDTFGAFSHETVQENLTTIRAKKATSEMRSKCQNPVPRLDTGGALARSGLSAHCGRRFSYQFVKGVQRA